jgi:hypothetical protein
MVESKEVKPDVTGAEQADKQVSKNWADEVDGGDDEETIGGASVPQVPKPEVRYKTPPKREKNARGELVISTIIIKDLDARPKDLAPQESEEEDSESEEEEEPVADSKEEVKGKFYSHNQV